MAAFGVVSGVALSLLLIVAFQSTIPVPKSHYHPQIVLGGVQDGVLLGGLAGIAMALYAALAHRSIRKPSHFRFAMLIVATIVSLVVIQQPFHIMTIIEIGTFVGDWISWTLSDPSIGLILFGAIGKHIAIGAMSMYVADRYLREATERLPKSTEKRAE